jgi:hypothetical protein
LLKEANAIFSEQQRLKTIKRRVENEHGELREQNNLEQIKLCSAQQALEVSKTNLLAEEASLIQAKYSLAKSRASLKELNDQKMRVESIAESLQASLTVATQSYEQSQLKLKATNQETQEALRIRNAMQIELDTLQMKIKQSAMEVVRQSDRIKQVRASTEQMPLQLQAAAGEKKRLGEELSDLLASHDQCKDINMTAKNVSSTHQGRLPKVQSSAMDTLSHTSKRARGANYRSPRLVRRLHPSRNETRPGSDKETFTLQAQTSTTRSDRSFGPKSSAAGPGSSAEISGCSQGSDSIALDDLFDATKEIRTASHAISTEARPDGDPYLTKINHAQFAPEGGSAVHSTVASGQSTPYEGGASGLNLLISSTATDSSTSPELQMQHMQVGLVRTYTTRKPAACPNFQSEPQGKSFVPSFGRQLAPAEPQQHDSDVFDVAAKHRSKQPVLTGELRPGDCGILDLSAAVPDGGQPSADKSSDVAELEEDTTGDSLFFST